LKQRIFQVARGLRFFEEKYGPSEALRFRMSASGSPSSAAAAASLLSHRPGLGS
jgi:hypothetical protein